MITDHRFRRMMAMYCRAWMCWLCGVALLVCGTTPATEVGADDSAPRQPSTLYVSKLGDNSDGSTWQKAFRTIQAALDAVPDDKAGIGSSCGPIPTSRPISPRPTKARPGPTTPWSAISTAASARAPRLGPDRLRRSGERVQELGLVGPDPGVRQALAARQQPGDLLQHHLGSLDAAQSLRGRRRWRLLLGPDRQERRRIHRDRRGLRGHRPGLRRRRVLSHRAARASRACFAAATSSRSTGSATRRPSWSAAGRRRCPNTRTPSSKTARWSIPTMPWPCRTPATAPGPSSSTAA